jgi:hypothetical protein
LWPCFVLCASVPLRTGSIGARICIERVLGGIVVVTPAAIEVWMSSWWNDRGHVGLGHGSCAPVDCARSCPSHRREQVPWLGGPHGSPSCQRVPHVPLRGSGALMTSWGLGRGEEMLPEAPVSPKSFPQGSGGMEFVIRAPSD